MGRSPFWTTVFQLLFLTTPNRLVGVVRRRFGFGPVEEIVVRGRKTDVDRHLFLVVARTDDGWIVAHPNGERAHWVRNLSAAGSAELIDRSGTKIPVRATLLLPGPDRDTAIDEHARQQVPALGRSIDSLAITSGRSAPSSDSTRSPPDNIAG